MKVKVNSQVSRKGEPPVPHGPNLGAYAPLTLGYLRLSPSRTHFDMELPAILLEIDGFA